MTGGKPIIETPLRPAPECEPGARRTPLWLWPHLLSLDAPAVAIGWQLWWARVDGANLRWFHCAILGLCVWMMYLADRLADALNDAPGENTSERHVFYRRRPLLAGAFLLAALGALAVLSPALLTAGEFAVGGALLILAAVYFWLIHGRRPWVLPLPKEAVVAALFTVGVSSFVGGAKGWTAPLRAQVAFFGLLCFLNCALITRWELSLQDRRQRTSLLNAFPRLAGSLGALAPALAAAAFAFGRGSGDLLAFSPLIVSSIGLWTLHVMRYQVPVAALRVLADVVLLTPWLWLVIR